MAMPTAGAPEMPEGARIDNLEGQINALLTFFSAVLQMPPDLERFSKAWVDAAEFQLVGELASTKSENYAKGQEEVRNRIANLIQFERARRGGG
jgi:hypothetical protein